MAASAGGTALDIQTRQVASLRRELEEKMENGSAVVKIPATGQEKLNVVAIFEGGNGLAYVEAAGEIAAPGMPMEHRPGALSSPTAPPVLALSLLVVLGSVWATYGFVVYQVVRIMRV